MNLVRFRVYEEYLRDADDRRIDPDHVADANIYPTGEAGTRSLTYEDLHVRCEIQYSQECDTIDLYVDKYRLQQVLFNFLDNAWKYKGASAGFEVRIEYRAQFADNPTYRDYYVLDVTDSGTIGIDKSERESIFTFGKRGQLARQQTTQGGFGRGLHVCRQIVREL